MGDRRRWSVLGGVVGVLIWAISLLVVPAPAGAGEGRPFDGWRGVLIKGDHRAIAANSATGHLLVTIGSDDEVLPNSLASVDVTTQATNWVLSFDSEPDQLAVAHDGSRVYVTFVGSSLIAEIALPDRTLVRWIDLGSVNGVALVPADLVVLPQDPEVIVVSRIGHSTRRFNSFPNYIVAPSMPETYGLAAYDRGARLSYLYGTSRPLVHLDVLDDGTVLAAGDLLGPGGIPNLISQILVQPEGLRPKPLAYFGSDRPPPLPAQMYGPFDMVNDRAFFARGQVFDLDRGLMGNLPGVGLVEADRQSGPVYQLDYRHGHLTVLAVNRGRFLTVDRFDIPVADTHAQTALETVGPALVALVSSHDEPNRLVFMGPHLTNAPDQPTNLRTDIDGHQVTLRWDMSNDVDVSGFIVGDSISNGAMTLTPSARTHTHETFNAPLTHTFKIFATSSNGGFSRGRTFSPVVFNGGRPAGYRLLEADGTVHSFGDATHYGNGPVPTGDPYDPSVSFAPSPPGNGYTILTRTGELSALGQAPCGARIPLSPRISPYSSISITPTGEGCWLFNSRGQVQPMGDALFLGDLGHLPLNGPIVSSIPTPSGDGYYMLGSDGGVFAFGDATFHGSIPQILPPGVQLNCPVVGLVPTPTGNGYWLVACDGGVFAFGDANFVGSLPGIGVVPNAPINGLVAFGNGYLMVASDGGVFQFGDASFFGSLGSNPPGNPIVAIHPYYN